VLPIAPRRRANRRIESWSKMRRLRGFSSSFPLRDVRKRERR